MDFKDKISMGIKKNINEIYGVDTHNTAFTERYFLNDGNGPEYTIKVDGAIFENIGILRSFIENKKIVRVENYPDRIALFNQAGDQFALSVIIDGKSPLKDDCQFRFLACELLRFRIQQWIKKVNHNFIVLTVLPEIVLIPFDSIKNEIIEAYFSMPWIEAEDFQKVFSVDTFDKMDSGVYLYLVNQFLKTKTGQIVKYRIDHERGLKRSIILEPDQSKLFALLQLVKQMRKVQILLILIFVVLVLILFK